MGHGRCIDDVLIVTIGDVIGHGITAAGAMGRLRVAAPRTRLANDDLAAVNELLSEFAALDQETAFASALLLRLDMSTGRAPSASRPVTLRRCSSPATRSREMAGGDAAARRAPAIAAAVAEARCDEGDAVVLYTDGLYERRGAHIDDRLAELADSASRATSTTRSTTSATRSWPT